MTFRWATVTSLDPLRIRMHGDSTPLLFTPETLVDAQALSVGDRVRCENTAGTLLIVGRLGGTSEPDVGYRLLAVVRYTASGTFSKADFPDARALRIRAVGGGGGGGGAATTGSGVFSCGTGGAGGGYAEKTITDMTTVAASTTITVGAGGSAGAGATGGTGGASSFGTTCAADGGVGGQVKPANVFSPYVSAPLGGIGTAGDLLIRGQGGGIGAGSDTLGSGGSGGSSGEGMGGGAPGVGNGSSGVVGVAGGNYGGGGSGAFNSSSQSARAGGAGAPGIVIVEVLA